MLTITLILVLAAFAALIAHLIGNRAPLWIAVLLLALAQLMGILPIR